MNAQRTEADAGTASLDQLRCLRQTVLRVSATLLMLTPFITQQGFWEFTTGSIACIFFCM